MIFKTLLLLSLTLSVWASDMDISFYQKNGIKALEKRFDAKLATKSYWSDLLKDQNLTLGYYEHIDTVLFCNKKLNKLKEFKLDKNHTIVSSKVLSTYTGKQAGDKETEGDLKTPEGVYDLVKRLNHVDPFYGPLALVTSYPNTLDKVYKKSGHGIWIHGFPLEGERDSFTKGCLAIDNEAIVKLSKDINYTQTKLIISPSTLPKVTSDQIATILAGLYKWRNSWKYNIFKTYINYYDTNFIRADGVLFKAFKHYKKALFERKSKKRIDLKNIAVIPYPNRLNEARFVITFFEDYKTRKVHFSGHKELYITLKDNNFTILSEK